MKCEMCGEELNFLYSIFVRVICIKCLKAKRIKMERDREFTQKSWKKERNSLLKEQLKR